jgi:hypothetical protein
MYNEFDGLITSKNLPICSDRYGTGEEFNDPEYYHVNGGKVTPTYAFFKYEYKLNGVSKGP